MRLYPAVLLLCAGCAASPTDETVAAAAPTPPVWVSRPDVARTASAPLLCYATGQAALAPADGHDARAYARAAEQAQLDALEQLAHRAEWVLSQAGLSAQRSPVVRALRDGARVKGRYADRSRYHVWLSSDLDRALAVAGVRVDDTARAALALALGESPDGAR